MKARGNTKIIIEKVGRIQTLVGQAQATYQNDRSSDRADKIIPQLQEAFELCLEIRNMYDPL
jgi:hypothetical protein